MGIFKIKNIMVRCNQLTFDILEFSSQFVFRSCKKMLSGVRQELSRYLHPCYLVFMDLFDFFISRCAGGPGQEL